MAVIEVGGLAFAHPGGTELFNDVTFRIGSGQHAALVGPNGVGKSTLLQIIAGRLRASAGSTRTDGSVAMMPQSIGTSRSRDAPIAERHTTSVRELLIEVAEPVVRDAATALRRAEMRNETSATEATGIALADAHVVWAEVGGYEFESRWDRYCDHVLGQTLAVAGSRPISSLSGGERKRLVLESLLDSAFSTLLLDEPDNFLDIPAKRWLESTIAASPKTILLISHDREILSKAASRVVTLEVNGCWTHAGNWATYDAARRRRNADLGDELARWRAEERRLFAHMKVMKQRAAVNDGNAPRANAAETRWKRFVDVGPPPTPPPERNVGIMLKGADSGRVVLRCDTLELDGLTEAFGLEVRQHERVAVLGSNGTGKSHFLRLLAGDDVAHHGRAQLGARVRAGLFHQTDDVPEFRGRTLLQILHDHDLVEERAMRVLARYGLTDGADRPYETLSGGQRARLQVLTLELSGVNLLLLDEPTDNLDLASAEALESALDDFDGTVLSVTHDRWFIRNMSRWLILDDDGHVWEALDAETALAVVSNTGDARPSPRLMPLSLSG